MSPVPHTAVRTRRIKIVHRPFKGAWFYEWQIGPVVLQVRHSEVASRFRRFHAWRDPFWRHHTK